MTDILQLYCDVDDFCRMFLPLIEKTRLSDGKQLRNRDSVLSMSEVMTILILFHQSGYRNLKTFYTKFICVYKQKEFPNRLSYGRFVELQSRCSLPLVAFMKTRYSKCSGISFIDSTSLVVCNNRRIHSNKVFKDVARRGKTSMGWFYGFKLHIVISDAGEILAVMITKGNVDDRQPVPTLSKDLVGKLFGDRGYISQRLFEQLFNQGVQLVTKIKKNMKNKLMPMFDKLMLRKRALIETVNDQLKNICQIEHTRHRSLMNFIGNVFAALIAYTYQEKKPSLNLNLEQFKALPAVVF